MTAEKDLKIRQSALMTTGEDGKYSSITVDKQK